MAAWHATSVARRTGVPGSAISSRALPTNGALQAGAARMDRPRTGATRRPGAQRAAAMLGRPSAAETVQVTNLVGPMNGLSEVITWTCGAVRMNARSAASSFQTEQGPVVAGERLGPQCVADQALCRGQLLAYRRDGPEETHRGGDPLQRQVGSHDQVAGFGAHLRAGCPGQVRHGSEPTSRAKRPSAAPGSGSGSPGHRPNSGLRHGSAMSPKTNLPGPASRPDHGSPSVASD